MGNMTGLGVLICPFRATGDCIRPVHLMFRCSSKTSEDGMSHMQLPTYKVDKIGIPRIA